MCMSRNTKEGHIAIVSSLSAHVPLPGQTAYSATKAALRVHSPFRICKLQGCARNS